MERVDGNRESCVQFEYVYWDKLHRRSVGPIPSSPPAFFFTCFLAERPVLRPRNSSKREYSVVMGRDEVLLHTGPSVDAFAWISIDKLVARESRWPSTDVSVFENDGSVLTLTYTTPKNGCWQMRHAICCSAQNGAGLECALRSFTGLLYCFELQITSLSICIFYVTSLACYPWGLSKKVQGTNYLYHPSYLPCCASPGLINI